MIKKNKLIYFLFFIILVNCSFDNKTGIWDDGENEKKRISILAERQNQVIQKNKIYSSERIFDKEILLNKKINLSKPKNNLSWVMPGLNYKNSFGNLYLPGVDNVVLKKKIGKNKFSLSKPNSSLLFFDENIILSDDTGTIYSADEAGKIKWRKNIYSKAYKKIYKILTFAIYENKIYIADNIGFVYAVNFHDGELVWVKNHATPFKSKIKIFENKIILINQDNRLLSFDTKDGSKIWDIRSISSFIKSKNLLSVSITKEGNIISINTYGDLTKINSKNGNIFWSKNTAESMLEHATDFFKFSDVVIHKNNIIFSTGITIFSFDKITGYTKWSQEVSSVSTPIVVKNNIFLVTENGYFVILNAETGKIISSTNILKVLKNNKQKTKITGFIMGSGKIYSVTYNGYLIVSSAYSGKVESFKKIGDLIVSNPIINDGKLFILTKNSRLFVFQ
tara:strand:+ start:1184 stop:2533 length:1350 start_codon:yes stop_codon:yes gene_type:complete